MTEYLRSKVVDILKTKSSDFGPKDWALFWIENYGGFDGAHHKDWVLDQVARILLGTEVIIKKATWSDGSTELRMTLGTPTKAYDAWVVNVKSGEDGPDTYEYSTGIAP